MAERTVKIDSGKTLQSFLGHVFEEGFKSSLAQKALTEKERQLKTAGSVAGNAAPAEEAPDEDVDSLFGGGGGGEEGGGEGAEDAQTNMPDIPDTDDQTTGASAEDDEAKLKSGNVSVKDIVEKLNSIRSGKSFKDSAVAKAIDEYVAKLKKPERVALMAFLNGIAQIVTGEVPGATAEDPGAHPADVKMDKGNEPKTIQKKPNIIKGSEVSKAAPKAPGEPGEEDTTPPAPIVPKKRAA